MNNKIKRKKNKAVGAYGLNLVEQVRQLEAKGIRVTDEMYKELKAKMANKMR
jgi:hypothetical protein